MAFDLVAVENRLWAIADPAWTNTGSQLADGVLYLPQVVRIAFLTTRTELQAETV